MITLLLLLMATFSWAETCPEDDKNLLHYVEVKKCSLEKGDLNAYSTQAETSEATRLSTRCQKNWKVKIGQKEISLPAGLRVIKLSPTSIAFPHEGKLTQGEIDPIAFQGDPNCPEKKEIPSAQAFYSEALFQLELAKKLDPKTNPPFAKKIDELIAKLKDLETKQIPFETISQHWEKMLSREGKSKVEQVSFFQAQLQKNYDPVTSAPRKTFESTLIVPLSLEWFQSTPELQKFYQKVWVGSHYDLRIASGGSGEGVSYYPKQSDESNESFLQMKSLLEKTAKFLEASHDKKLQSGPEGRWLKQQSGKISHYERMIFFSPETWINNSHQSPWADYIPVDQSLGGLPSDYLLSVMIHEINVNTPNYLARDTHGPMDETKNLRKCVQKHSLAELDQDPVAMERFLGLNSQISVLYLKMLLQSL